MDARSRSRSRSKSRRSRRRRGAQSCYRTGGKVVGWFWFGFGFDLSFEKDERDEQPRPAQLRWRTLFFSLLFSSLFPNLT